MSAIKSITTGSTTAVAQQKSPFFRLPPELGTRIFTFLESNCIFTSKRLCREWYGKAPASFLEWQAQLERIEAGPQSKYVSVWNGAKGSEKLSAKEWEQFTTQGPRTRTLDLFPLSLGKVLELFDYEKDRLFPKLECLRINLRVGGTGLMSRDKFDEWSKKLARVAMRIPIHCPEVTSLHIGVELYSVVETLLPGCGKLQALTFEHFSFRSAPKIHESVDPRSVIALCPKSLMSFNVCGGYGNEVREFANVPLVTQISVTREAGDTDLETFVSVHHRTNVETCRIWDQKLTNKGMSHLARMSGLRSLDISFAKQITDLSVTHKLRMLKSLRIYAAGYGVLPSLLKTATRGLQEISLVACKQTLDSLALMQDFPDLCKLTIDNPDPSFESGSKVRDPIDDKAFLQLAAYKSLRTLTLGDVGSSAVWRQITENGIIKTCLQCPSLRELHFTGWRKPLVEIVNLEVLEKALSSKGIQVYVTQLE